MKKVIKIAVICFLTSFLLVGCGTKDEEQGTITEDQKFQVVFKNDDGTELLNVKADKDSEIKIANPTKEATNEYTYTFTGWDKEITPVTEDKTYTAQYAKTKREYTVTFKNGDDVLSTDKYTYGQIPTAPEKPAKESTVDYVYDFDNWQQTVATSTSNYVIYGLAPVTSNVTYDAAYKEVATTTNSLNFCYLSYDDTIDGYAFNGLNTSLFSPSSLTDLIIGDIYDDGTHGAKPIKKIYDDYYGGLDNLKTIRIGKNVQTIPSSNTYLFPSSNKLEKIIVDEENPYFNSIDGDLYTEDGKEFILGYANGRKSVSFPQTVEKVRFFALMMSNGSIEEITFNSNFIDIDSSMLSTYCLSGSSSAVKKVTFNEGVTKIADWLLYSFDKLETVIIPNTVEEIGAHAFTECAKLENINIPASVNCLHFSDDNNPNNYAFNGCNATITIDNNNATYKIENGAIYSKDGKIIYRYVGDKSIDTFTIPEGVEEVGDFAFYECSALKTISVPNSIEKVTNYSFSTCFELTYNAVGEGLYLGNEENNNLILMYIEDDTLTEYFISKDVKIIMQYVFENLTQENVTIKYEGTEEEWANIIKQYGDDDHTGTTLTVTFNQTND